MAENQKWHSWDFAFKPNIDDLRESPAKYIAQKVLQNQIMKSTSL